MLRLPAQRYRRNLGPHNGQVPMPPYFIEEAFDPKRREDPSRGAVVLGRIGTGQYAALAREWTPNGEREVILASRTHRPNALSLLVCSAMPGDTMGCRTGLVGMDCRLFEVWRADGEWKVSEPTPSEAHPPLINPADGTEMDARTDVLTRVRGYLARLASAPPEHDPMQSDAAARVLLELSALHDLGPYVELAGPTFAAKAHQELVQ